MITGPFYIVEYISQAQMLRFCYQEGPHVVAATWPFTYLCFTNFIHAMTL